MTDQPLLVGDGASPKAAGRPLPGPWRCTYRVSPALVWSRVLVAPVLAASLGTGTIVAGRALAAPIAIALLAVSVLAVATAVVMSARLAWGLDLSADGLTLRTALRRTRLPAGAVLGAELHLGPHPALRVTTTRGVFHLPGTREPASVHALVQLRRRLDTLASAL